MSEHHTAVRVGECEQIRGEDRILGRTCTGFLLARGLVTKVGCENLD